MKSIKKNTVKHKNHHLNKHNSHKKRDATSLDVKLAAPDRLMKRFSIFEDNMIEKPSSFNSATIESTNKNIHSKKKCSRATLHPNFISSIKSEKCNKEKIHSRKKENCEFQKKRNTKTITVANNELKNSYQIKTKIDNAYNGSHDKINLYKDLQTFSSVRKRFEESSLKRSTSLNSIKQNHLNKNPLIIRSACKFKDLYTFFSNLEKINELKRSVSCVDIQPIRKQLDLIDYDTWKTMHDKTKIKKKFEGLHAQIKEMEKAKRFIYECSNINTYKWKKDKDFGLRNRLKNIEDLKKIFTNSPNQEDIFLKNNFLRNDELLRKHGVSSCLVKLLSNSQIHKLQKQLNDIYCENVSENHKAKMKHKNKFNSQMNIDIKNKIEYYEQKMFFVPPGNTIYRARSDIEQGEFKDCAESSTNNNYNDTENASLNNRNPSSLTTSIKNCNALNKLKTFSQSNVANNFCKSVSTGDLTDTRNLNYESLSLKKSNNCFDQSHPSSFHSDLKNTDIYERLNLFILKKLENMNGKYIK